VGHNYHTSGAASVAVTDAVIRAICGGNKNRAFPM
jgi:hypothetical protein